LKHGFKNFLENISKQGRWCDSTSARKALYCIQ